MLRSSLPHWRAKLMDLLHACAASKDAWWREARGAQAREPSVDKTGTEADGGAHARSEVNEVSGAGVPTCKSLPCAPRAGACRQRSQHAAGARQQRIRDVDKARRPSSSKPRGCRAYSSRRAQHHLRLHLGCTAAACVSAMAAPAERPCRPVRTGARAEPRRVSQPGGGCQGRARHTHHHQATSTCSCTAQGVTGEPRSKHSMLSTPCKI